jgi:hypothetical protein
VIDLVAFLSGLQSRGVELVADGNQLRYRAPKGILTADDLDLLNASKASIIAHIRGDARGQARRDGHETPDRRGSGRHVPGAVSTVTSSNSNPREDAIASHKSQYSRNGRAKANCAICASEISTVGRDTSRSHAAPEPPGERAVKLGDRILTYTIWDGTILDSDLIGFDTETTVIKGNEIPELALASASSGTAHFLIHPDHLAAFILGHRDRYFVLHNCAFDYWVLAQHLRQRHEEEALAAWAQIVEENRMHDTMLLDELIRLGKSDEYPRHRNLAEVAREYADLEVDKNNPYRLKYGEIIGQDWTTVERGFFEYAIKDPIVTLAAFEAMHPIAIKVMEDHGYVSAQGD